MSLSLGPEEFKDQRLEIEKLYFEKSSLERDRVRLIFGIGSNALVVYAFITAIMLWFLFVDPHFYTGDFLRNQMQMLGLCYPLYFFFIVMPECRRINEKLRKINSAIQAYAIVLR